MNQTIEQFSELSLEVIANGEAIKQVDYQLGQAIENCLDPNTRAEAVRKVTLTLTLKPTPDREKAELTYTVETKFPGDAPGVELVHIARGKKRGFVSRADQMSIDEMIRKVNENVAEMADRKEKAE